MNFLLVLVTFPVALAWVIGAISTVGGPIATLILEQVLPGGDMNGLAELLGINGRYDVAVDIAMQVVGGLIFLLTVGPVVRGLTTLHQAVACVLLGTRYDEQQRLVRAPMDLARAEAPAAKDPERAQSVLREAREQLGPTLDDLRRLSRGIAPTPVPMDRARIGDEARARIEDAGQGGAEMRTGGGLDGRVASLEGRFSVHSPEGIGTRIEAVIPCAS